MNNKRAFLLILDGWGLGQDPVSDAIAQANTPFMDQLLASYPHSKLITHGEDVGLPEGQMGNSEVGHLNIGAGRVVYQELARINQAVRTGSLHKMSVLTDALEKAKKNGKAVHIFGLVSDGGVHSHISHLEAICDIAEAHGPEHIYIHAFTDGRDVDPKSGLGFIQRLQSYLTGKRARVASVIGRYYAMDRDRRWERIKKAYDLMVRGVGKKTEDLAAAIANSYRADITDEFIEPIVLVDERGQAVGKIEEGDLLICFNFRTDRPRQISEVLTQSDFPEQDMKKLDVDYVTMTRYDEQFKNIDVLFTKDDLKNTLGEVLAQEGKSQVRIAETEKYPHVTFFFSGGREDEFPGERRLLIPSPKVATYDLQPEMSAGQITTAILNDIQQNTPDFICLNFANTDMVGHTGDFKAAKIAAETVDNCLAQIIPLALDYHYQMLIIADHGNSDMMINPDGSPNTAHTTNLVPCIYVGNQKVRIENGRLADVAPTLLSFMGIKPPEEFTGKNLVSQLVLSETDV